MSKNIFVRDYFNQDAEKYSAGINERISKKRALFIRNYKQDPILEIGVGPASLASKYLDKEKFYGVDISREMIKIAQKNIPEGIFFVADAEQLNFKNEFFSTVVASEVIYYCQSPERLIQEALRVLKSDGRLILIWGNSRYNFIYKILSFLKLRPDDPLGLKTIDQGTVENIITSLPDHKTDDVLKDGFGFPFLELIMPKKIAYLFSPICSIVLKKSG